jgi:hypothetical protein
VTTEDPGPTMADVEALHQTYADLEAAHETWGDLERGDTYADVEATD